MTAETLPLLNAILNGISTVLLITGYVMVLQRRYRAHASMMIAAFVTSSLFLIGYIAHKIMYENKSPDLEAGPLAYFYWFVILLPHVVLAMVMVPMIVTTLLRAYWRQWDKHRRIARPTFWIWLYVSVTGVIIYWMLYHLFPGMQRQT